MTAAAVTLPITIGMGSFMAFTLIQSVTLKVSAVSLSCALSGGSIAAIATR